MDDRRGRLYGLGTGPGDPELLTLKAVRLLREAAVIAYQAPERGASFARSIVAQWLDGSRPEIAIRFPMRPGPVPRGVYDGAAAALSAQLDRGRGVTDPARGPRRDPGGGPGDTRRMGTRSSHYGRRDGRHRQGRPAPRQGAP